MGRVTAPRGRAVTQPGVPARLGRTGALAASTLASALVLLAGCSGSSSGAPPVPTFPGPGATAATSAPPSRTTLLPTDCNQLLPSDNLPNLLGLPLGTIEVTALRDVPAPSVGRLERVTCNYTSTGGPSAPPNGALVLKILSSGYTTPPAAAAQAQANTQIEEQSGTSGVPTPIGTAQSTYFDDPDGPLLVVVYGRITTSLTLPPGAPVGRDQARSVLVDLAQRVLPVLVPAGGP